MFSEDGDYFEVMTMVKLKPSAWITLASFGIIGTATRFKHGQYFELTGTRGNVWLFNIDEVLALAKKSKNKEHKAYALQIEKDVNSKIGLNVGFPLAYLINNVTEDFGDDAVISLNRSKERPISCVIGDDNESVVEILEEQKALQNPKELRSLRIKKKAKKK